MKKVNQIKIRDEFVTLGQFLKLADIIGSGGQAKWFLQEYEVYVNEELEDRRGRKLYIGDEVDIPGEGRFEIVTGE
nr:S4 domain-containing protein YaaA [Kurthia huakuii]